MVSSESFQIDSVTFLTLLTTKGQDYQTVAVCEPVYQANRVYIA